MRYARITSGHSAGTVAVKCLPTTSPGECEVTVRYDVTALAQSGLDFVVSLEDGYEAFIRTWRNEILAVLRT